MKNMNMNWAALEKGEEIKDDMNKRDTGVWKEEDIGVREDKCETITQGSWIQLKTKTEDNLRSADWSDPNCENLQVRKVREVIQG